MTRKNIPRQEIETMIGRERGEEGRCHLSAGEVKCQGILVSHNHVVSHRLIETYERELSTKTPKPLAKQL